MLVLSMSGALTAATLLDTSFNPGSGANGLVETVITQPDGKILICGNFTSFNGVDRSYIARLNHDGSVDTSFLARPGYWVRHMTLQSDGRIVIGGFFTSVDGQPRGLVARLNHDGSLDTSFDPGTGARGTLGVSITGNPDPFVFYTAVQSDGKILITGNFTNYNGTTIYGIARVNANGSLDTTFDVGSGLSSWGRSIQVLASHKILVTGWFDNYHNSSHNRMALINPDGTPDSSFNPVVFGDKTAVYGAQLLPSGKYIAVGHSLNELGLFQQEIVRLNADGSVDSSFGAFANDKIQAVRLQSDGKLILVGEFSQMNGQPIKRLARLNADGSLDADFNADIDNFLWSAAIQSDGRILVSGGFTTIDGVPRGGVARLYLNKTGTPPPTDTTGPAIQITSPASTVSRVFDPALTITGTARDSSGIASLIVSVDRGSVSSISGTTSWSATVNLAPGTNVVTITARDSANNTTSINRRFIYVVLSTLTVTVNGAGSVTPNLGGTQLEVGRGYALTAHPAAGAIFANWSGDASASTPTIHFTMQPGMNLQANFIPNPFPPLSGYYSGLFSNPDSSGLTTAGNINLTLNGRGTFSGRIIMATASYPISGAFDATLNATVTIARRGQSNLQINLQLPGNDTLQGSVSDGSFTSSLTAYRATFGARNPASNFQGHYTALLPGGSSPVPAGHGFLTVLVNPNGHVVLSGSLADGVSIVSGGSLSPSGNVPFFYAYGHGQAVAFGWILFASNDSTDVQGTVRWEKAASSNTNAPSGFANAIQIFGSRYAHITSGSDMHWTNAVLALRSGDLSADIIQSFSFTDHDQFVFPAPNDHSFGAVLNPAWGNFHGRFVDPATQRFTAFQGVLLQRQNVGGGYFLSSGHSGSVFINEGGSQP
jgi:uncharacterized delta-60 repeat protein